MSKISTKMRLDVESMLYYTQDSSAVTEQDIIDTAVYSSTGNKPGIETPGFFALKWGKTYRDEAITGYKDMLEEGLVTKAELISDMPDNLKKWLWDKIKNFVYGGQDDMFMRDYHSMSDKEKTNMGCTIITALVIMNDNPSKDGREILLGI